ncbi:MAG TPA: alpha/beta hydrolase, partial [Clostridia bacterium]|nr:alpha/beta hydrolase [Clostridia bacterium]
MKKRIILVHGYYKNKKDMSALEKNLEELGNEVISVELPLTFEDITYATSVFEETVTEVICTLKENEKINLVGHSTGGIVIRLFLSNTKYINKIYRCVLIAVPNKGSKLADMASRLFPRSVNVFKTLKSLKCENVRKLQLKNIDSVEIGAIAGSKSNLLSDRLLGGKNDGKVEINSAICGELKDFIVLPFNHTEIHHKFETAELVDAFLE